MDQNDREILLKLVKKYGHRTVELEISYHIEQQNEIEPILDHRRRKFTAFPIEFPEVWDMYKDQLSKFWKPEEIDFSNDYDDFMTMDKDTQHFIKMVLSFFAAADGIVNFNLSERFLKDIQINEIIICYTFQMFMESIHSETYSLQLENLVKDKKEQEYLFKAISTVESVKMIKDWAFKWIDSSASFAHRVVAFAVIEGVIFSGAFAAIYWIKQYAKTKISELANSKQFLGGLISSNHFIARDEFKHTQFACLLYSLLVNKLSESEVYQIVTEGVRTAQYFMTDALPVKLIGMNSEEMSDYLEYVADRLLGDLGYNKLFNKKNPYNFVEIMGTDNKANFFETRPTEYVSAHTSHNVSKGQIHIVDDF